MKNLIKYSIIAGMLSSMLSISCKKFISIDPPETKAEQKLIFTSDQTATAAVLGTYRSLLSGNGYIFNGGITAYCALYADELSSPATNATTEPFRSNTLLADNGTIESFWLLAYKSLYQANACIEGLEGSQTLSAGTKQQLLAEMFFTRAFIYFNMANLFGDVPLVTSTDYVVNSAMPRTDVSIVYDQVVKDLIKAREFAATLPALPNTRPGRLAASALLAKVYLYLGKTAEADLMATEVIESGKYTLANLPEAFLATSKETILQFSKSNGNASEATMFNPSSATAKPTYNLISQLLAAFEPGDARKASWVKTVTLSGVTYNYPYKYKNRAATPITELMIVERLAEVYLIRAEARAREGRLSLAIDDIDMVRKRAGLTPIRTSNPNILQSDLIEAILKERRIELFAEWGNRYFDLKRTGMADTVLGVVKAPTWQATDKLFPLPIYQIQSNPNLVQNPGY